MPALSEISEQASQQMSFNIKLQWPSELSNSEADMEGSSIC